jgi:uncharacterized membrane protein
MVTGLEIALVLVVLAVVFGAYKVVKTVKPFIWNAIVGLIILVAADVFLGLSVAIEPLTILIVAIGGVPGAILVLLLAYLDVAFVATMVLF